MCEAEVFILQKYYKLQKYIAICIFIFLTFKPFWFIIFIVFLKLGDNCFMLELKNITKVYGTSNEEVKALKGVSIKFRESEFVSILGQSGCRKNYFA